jgi:phage tail-like protein
MQARFSAAFGPFPVKKPAGLLQKNFRPDLFLISVWPVIHAGADTRLIEQRRDAYMRGQTRREFLCKTIPAAVATGAALTFGPFRNALAAQLPPATDRRGYTAAKFALELDGQFAGWVESWAGGHAASDVVAGNNLVGGNIQRKHIAGIKYEDITVNCGTGMSKNFYDWIKASSDKQYLRKSGAVVTADYNGKERSRLNWTNALLTEVTFPALDAASKDAAKMTVKISPEVTRYETSLGGAAVAAAAYKSGQTVQKKWLASNFRLQIAGLEQACTRVSKVEAITLRFANAELPLGAGRASIGVPPRFQASNLVVTLPEQDAMPFYNWYRDVVTKGSNATNEREGLLAYLTPDLREPIFVLGLHGLSLFKWTPEIVAARGESIRRAQVEFSCKDMTFSPAAAAWA